MAYVASGALVVDTRGIDQTLKTLRKDQVPYAKMLAVNDLAFDTVRVERLEAIFSLHRPTPWFIRSIAIAKKASKKDPTAAVWIGETVKDLYGKSMYELEETFRSTGVARPQIFGGSRNVKASEKRLRQIGVIDKDDWLTAGGSARLNQHGNITGDAHQQMLSYFRAYREAGFNANRVSGASSNKRGIRYFVRPVGRGKGIFRVQGKGKAKLIWYVTKKRPTYRPRFDFFRTAYQHAGRYSEHFARKAMRKALKTAR